ncbi:MAG TPA: maleylpyruvate isomerase family mycothiol-dependent enzyme [Acidimicrobiales bacterium]|nr:maleylpyruvate isomerase family mycothiol-dependent enzyme [Acidimicrobiales bacterium]
MTTTTAEAHVPWSHAEAMALAEEAYDRVVAVLESLDPDDWDRPTDCEGWTVRDLAGHLVGALRSAASIRELARQQLGAKRRARAEGGDEVDHMTAIQVASTAALSNEQLVTEARRLVPKAVAGRRRTPALLRRTVRIPVTMGSLSETWTLGWFVDVCLTRDAWLHKIDLCRAVGQEPALTPEHDGRIVADVVDDWARRHGRPFHLVLTGPAGGRFGDPAVGDPLEVDAVDLCRILSGRSSGTGLLATEVPF